MKKYISFLALLAHSSIYKIFILLAGLTAVHSLFLSVWIDRMLITLLVFAAELGLLVWILSRDWIEGISHQSYTLQRLSITQKEIFYIQAAYNLLCLLLFWGVHLIGAYVFYTRNTSGTQNLFLEFTGSGYLHSLMPGADWLSWIKNISILMSLAVITAMYPSWQRISEKKEFFILTCMVVLTAMAFSIGIDNLTQKALCIFWAVYLPFMLRRDRKRKEAEAS